MSCSAASHVTICNIIDFSCAPFVLPKYLAFYGVDIDTPYGVRTSMARSIENRVYPFPFRFKFNVCLMYAPCMRTYNIHTTYQHINISTYQPELSPPGLPILSRSTEYGVLRIEQVTWKLQCQSRWSSSWNTVLVAGHRRSGTCKDGLPRTPSGSAADTRRHLGVRDLTSVEELFFTSVGWCY